MGFYLAWFWVMCGVLLGIPTLLLLRRFSYKKTDGMSFDDYLLAFIKCIAFGPGTIVFFWPMFSIWLKVRKRNDSRTEGPAA